MLARLVLLTALVRRGESMSGDAHQNFGKLPPRAGSCIETPGEKWALYDLTPKRSARGAAENVATVNPSVDAVIPDAADLAHPKDVIKSVLQHCIKTIEGADERTFLRTAYLSLGSYQELTDEERKALSALREVGPPGPPQSELQEEQAKRIREFAIPLQAVTDRLKSETAILTQELKLLPGQD